VFEPRFPNQARLVFLKPPGADGIKKNEKGKNEKDQPQVHEGLAGGACPSSGKRSG